MTNWWASLVRNAALRANGSFVYAPFQILFCSWSHSQFRLGLNAWSLGPIFWLPACLLIHFCAPVLSYLSSAFHSFFIIICGCMICPNIFLLFTTIILWFIEPKNIFSATITPLRRIEIYVILVSIIMHLVFTNEFFYHLSCTIHFSL